MENCHKVAARPLREGLLIGASPSLPGPCLPLHGRHGWVQLIEAHAAPRQAVGFTLSRCPSGVSLNPLGSGYDVRAKVIKPTTHEEA